ncbi:uncharacterized protein NP_2068A [Natronomonas pharaonis DSM 2160]|uniref:CopG domain protein n=1 Tax=Natronomonas pharaonis (strain ATCC 35678 / DSM 2160 / CIP 103997 / JCM 8858 / NBRC 14720 / NCIMB 2260 / Gabara) TaxID=348780 RepID=A0A1U7EVQ0_NATPD|nr:hypothetical protein [Natronomonas pharaonis]CAI49125.1 uncharacterized protein NP_2068A [Natronomonas pharaonis DSM 2160]
MTSRDEAVDVEVAFEEGTLLQVDMLRQQPGYETRSDVVAAAIEAASD